MENKKNYTYPALLIDKVKLAHNTRLLKDMCDKHRVKLAVVTKVYCGTPEIAEIQVAAGADYIADSRIENLKKMKDLEVPKILLRIPMKSEVQDVVRYSDISQNSEIEVIKALGAAAISQNKTHDIILMVDMGDLREGVWSENAVEYAGEIFKIKGINLKGIGMNLSCYGGIIPSVENTDGLVRIAEEIEKKYGIHLDIISGGNSSSVNLMNDGEMNKRVNMIRLGESIVLGMSTSDATQIPNTFTDIFTLAVEIVELKEKPSIPVGEIGLDAFGEVPTFKDKGIMKRAIAAIGKQDVKLDNLRPRDENVEIIGGSSDHLIIDVTESKKDYKVGDILEFDVNYGALLALCTSEYVKKILI